MRRRNSREITRVQVPERSRVGNGTPSSRLALPWLGSSEANVLAHPSPGLQRDRRASEGTIGAVRGSLKRFGGRANLLVAAQRIVFRWVLGGTLRKIEDATAGTLSPGRNVAA